MATRTAGLYSETYGNGPEIVMLHGWGMHSGVWRDFAAQLARQFRVTLVDLPGHGRSGLAAHFTLDELAPLLAAVTPAPAHWLGWSLGATVALHVASHYPERVSSLTMLAGNARFTQAPDWPCAMEITTLERFAAGMLADHHDTLMRFLALQTWGLDDARAVLRQLRERLLECGDPELEALRLGLDILRHADLRAELGRLPIPLLLLMGGRDRLVPAAAGSAMAQLAPPTVELKVLERAAHVPFITHPDECLEILARHWLRHG